MNTEWGWYDLVLDMPLTKVKVLHLNKGKSLSLQKNKERNEFFFMPDGEVRIDLSDVRRVLSAGKNEDLEVLIVQAGK